MLPKSKYLAMRLCLAESACMEAQEGFRHLKEDEKIQQLKKIELLAWEIEKLKEGRF